MSHPVVIGASLILFGTLTAACGMEGDIGGDDRPTTASAASAQPSARAYGGFLHLDAGTVTVTETVQVGRRVLDQTTSQVGWLEYAGLSPEDADQPWSFYLEVGETESTLILADEHGGAEVTTATPSGTVLTFAWNGELSFRDGTALASASSNWMTVETAHSQQQVGGGIAVSATEHSRNADGQRVIHEVMIEAPYTAWPAR